MDIKSSLSKVSSPGISFHGQNISKYVLGTAQLGQTYGIANRDGIPDRDRAREIVACAWEAGAKCFDTAQGYGRSEAVLGQALSDNGISHEALVITKLRSDHDPSSPNWVAPSVMDSLQYLNVSALFGVMLHRYDWMQHLDGALGNELRQLRDQGFIRYLGISVYTIEEAISALEHPDVDLVQAPCNLWNPELYLDEIFEYATRLEKCLFVRSIYLQGLLLMNPSDIAIRLPRAEKASKVWHDICTRYSCTPEELCMRFAATLPAPIVIGADNEMQAAKNGKIVDIKPLIHNEVEEIYEEMRPYLSDEIVNPSLW